MDAIKINEAVIVETPRFSHWPYFIFISIFASLLSFAIYLKPSVNGIGTHEQLGLPPCGFLHFTGIPCPACGLTTSISHIGHGEILDSVKVQPFGTVLFVTLLGMCVFSILNLIRKVPFSDFSESLVFEWLQYILLILFLASWGYKIYIMKFASLLGTQPS